ncbi:hypothetical protein CRN76_07425 [Chryseobacterium indologenes]|nr:hypothetical protein CEQ15_06445 [Chryseobacterium indologenes]ATN05246.1 hypothetical protein CRN76_07425 [Chryseobacterium indologenes]AYY85999.1 hypothetical protein EGX91_16320 [Chryseobacterium indologenes]HAO26624.1 hypothetical protein [Chryseobacterium indologenes]
MRNSEKLIFNTQNWPDRTSNPAFYIYYISRAVFTNQKVLFFTYHKSSLKCKSIDQDHKK